ncbi:Acyl carrier protein phosphodiesterase [compost metagenome]
MERFYQSLHQNRDLLTSRTQGLMPYMIQHNWLVSYQTVEGINRILTQMDSRTNQQSKMRFATNELLEFYSDFEAEFTPFFEDLQTISLEKLTQL